MINIPEIRDPRVRGYYGTYTRGILPIQNLPMKKKDKEWKRATMDALEAIGLKQLKDNLKFKDFYRMAEGKMAVSELKEVLPHLKRMLEEYERDPKFNCLKDTDVPTFIKHYDLIGKIINAMVGEYMQHSDSFQVTNIDEISTNEYERQKKDLFVKHLTEEFQKELNLRLMKMGLDPDIETLKFESDEEKQAYIQNIENQKKQMTPEEIEKWVNTKWRTQASIWAEYTLKADHERFAMDDMDRVELRDFLLTGRCFRHYKITSDSYTTETWSPLNTFFSQDVNTKYIQDCDFVGRVHYFTPNQLITRYGYYLTQKEKDYILGLDSRINKTNLHRAGKQVPVGGSLVEQYYMGSGERIDEGVNRLTNFMEDTVEVVANGGGYSINAPFVLNSDLDLRDDLIQVTEAYWVSFKRVGYLCYEEDSGFINNEIVTEDILPSFLKEHKIKTLKEVSLDTLESEDQEVNTIIWEYVPEVWQGIKINLNGFEGDSLYVNIKPMDFQDIGNSNMEIKLPVAGIIGESVAFKMLPFQMMYNVVMNQIYNLLERELGVFILFDLNFLPSEYKNMGDTTENLLQIHNMIKETGIAPIEGSTASSQFNLVNTHNVSFASQFSSRIQLSEFFQNKAYEQVGFNLQRLGTPVAYTTAEGIKQSQNASYSQTERYFAQFSEYKKRALELHLNVAKHAQEEGKDLTIMYTKSDATKQYLHLSDENFQLRRLGILPISSSKTRKDLETFKQYLISTNTLGEDVLALAKLFSADNMVELVEIAEQSVRRKQQALEESREHDAYMLEKSDELQAKRDLIKWKREEYSKQQDRINRIDTKTIEAIGRAADNNATEEGFRQILDSQQRNLDRDKLHIAINNFAKSHKLNKERLDLEREKFEHRREYDMEKLHKDEKQLEVRLKESNDKVYTSTINKN